MPAYTAKSGLAKATAEALGLPVWEYKPSPAIVAAFEAGLIFDELDLADRGLAYNVAIQDGKVYFLHKPVGDRLVAESLAYGQMWQYECRRDGVTPFMTFGYGLTH